MLSFFFIMKVMMIIWPLPRLLQNYLKYPETLRVKGYVLSESL